MKKLLSACLFAVVALSANAYKVGDNVYTKVAKFKIIGENLVTNGQFNQGDTGMDGWTATDKNVQLATTFVIADGQGPDGQNALQVLPGQNATTNGAFQKVEIKAGGTYVIGFKVMGASAGYTDYDLVGSNENYMMAYYNTDGTLATGRTAFGADGVNAGYQFSFTPDGYTEVVFSVTVEKEGYIMIDFRAMADGLMIADVTCHAAQTEYDDRLAAEKAAYYRVFTESEALKDCAGYDNLVAKIEAVEEAIKTGAEGLESLLGNMDLAWDEFCKEDGQLPNMIDFIPGKDGQVGTGNNSANWMHWNSHLNKLNSEYKGQAPWTWNVDRWHHKQAKVDGKYQSLTNVAMGIQWAQSSSGDWTPIATLTTKLEPGIYFWGVSGSGGHMCNTKNSWDRSWANECAATQLFFYGDTTDVFYLDPAREHDYVFPFEVTEEDTITTLGIICKSNMSVGNGFDVRFYSPVLYKLNVGGLSPEEEAYINNAYTQLEALKGRIEVANGYLAEANDSLPWGKDTLEIGVKIAQERYEEWASYTEDDILGWYDNEETLADTIMNNGVRFLNNNYITPYETKNKPLTDMPGAIATAKATLDMRIYTSSTKKGEFRALIIASENLYAKMLKAEYSAENAQALVDQKAALEAMAVEFKDAMVATAIIDINFDGATMDTVTTVVDSLETTSYVVKGALGEMTFTDVLGSYCYTLGWAHDVTDETTGEVSTVIDSVGMLRVGNSEATVAVPAAPVVEAGGILNIQFDYYYGNLKDKKAGYKVLSAEGDTICGLFCSKYSGNDDLNTFGVDYNGKISGVGSSGNENAKIAASSNRTHFDIVLDYGLKTMYCTTSGSKGTVTTEVIALPDYVPAKFVVYSNYNNANRRSWFDNLKIMNVSTVSAPDGIDNLEVIRPVDNNMYNLQGQRILAPVKGQIYIQNGRKMIAK